MTEPGINTAETAQGVLLPSLKAVMIGFPSVWLDQLYKELSNTFRCFWHGQVTLMCLGHLNILKKLIKQIL